MKVIRTPETMQSIALKLKRAGKTIGLVPTMGALHKGHLSLILKAKKENDIVIVSVFVNPKQFGPKEDYLRYPRPFGKDVKLCGDSGVDFIFAPSVEAMYPAGYRTYANVEDYCERLCGKFRPGHFRGVATVVLKLLNITQAVRAYFGQKDYQQLKIIQRMAEDLNIAVKIIPCPVVREESGLALSSRNRYLSKSQSASSAIIYKTLHSVSDLIKSKNIKSAVKILKYIHKSIKSIPGSKIDYAEVLDAGTLDKQRFLKFPLVIAVAVWVGKTRLIDNIIIE